jgi:hypothetical protein
MAYNRSILGGSPLGLIGVSSYYNPDGLSSFNGGKSRNVKVSDYNKNKSYAGGVSGNSLFSGSRVVRAWPSVKADDPKGLNDVDYGKVKTDNSTRKELHNNSIYDTSVLNILEKLSGTKAQLRPTDFAYLKNIGVFPNNRLMIARRFAGPVDDNIMTPKKDSDLGAFATLISWKPENENFLDISFGEEWTESEADFTDILTAVGKDIKLDNLGGIGGDGGNILPLPGFTEIFQRNFLEELGLLEEGAGNSIPAGNPNLIKQSKRRKLVGYGAASSGLKCKVNVKMTCEYELKYISGIDPTIVWMDLLGMILRFGTSNSETYGLSKSVGAKLILWANNPNLLIEEAAAAIGRAIIGIADAISTAITEVYDKAITAANKLKFEKGGTKKTEDKGSNKSIAKKAAETAKEASLEALDELRTELAKAIKKGLSGILQKYRVKIIGIINSLTGLPSTPWHITIGNPMRPVFCSGDMLVEDVDLKLGPNLAFNDLPSSITVEFTMANARPWGLQEIMAKFNSGYLRTVDVQKTFYETNKIVGEDGKTYPEVIGVLPLSDVSYGNSGTSGTSGSSGSSGVSGTGTNDTNANGGTIGVVGTNGTSGTPVVVSATDSEGTSKANGGQKTEDLITNKDANSPVYVPKN